MDPSTILAAEYSVKADAYARHWSPVIRPMAQPILGALPLVSAARVVDVGAGTGALLGDLQQAAPSALVIGLDYSEGMLRLARGAGCGVLVVGDAQQLAIRADAIDVAVLAFVLFHVPDPLRALREVARMLRPGGSAGIVAWGRDMETPGLSAWKEELDRQGAEPDPRDASVMQHALMDTADKLDGLLRQTGFADVTVWSQRFDHQWASDELFKVQRHCGVAARRLPSLDAGRRAACEARVRARLDRLDTAALAFHPEVLFGIGRKPAEGVRRSPVAAS